MSWGTRTTTTTTAASGAVRRRRAAMVAAAVVAAAAVTTLSALTASPAGAHAELVSSSPADGEQLDTAPDRIVLGFTESVEVAPDGVELYASSGDALETGAAAHPGGDGAQVAADLPPLDDGGYVVAWRVTSTDGHPISGAFTFGVAAAGGAGAAGSDAAGSDAAGSDAAGSDAAGSDADAEALRDDLLADAGGDRTLGVVYGLARFAAFGGVVVLVGGGAFLLALWPAGAGDRRARRLVAGGWWTTLVATAAGLGLHGAYVADLSLGDALDPSVIGDELGTRTGRAAAARLVVLAAVAALAALVARWRPDPDAAPARPGRRASDEALFGAGVLGLALLATVSVGGHAVSGRLVPVAFVVDVVHLAAASVWLGGLAVLVAVLLRPGRAVARAAGPELDRVVDRFSSVAFAAVVVIVLTGVVQAWRQLGGLDAVGGTTYGRLLLAKVALVAAMVGAAAFSRAWVRRRAGAPVPSPPEGEAAPVLSPGPGAAPASGGPPVRALRRSVGAEALIAVAVLAVTALLVNAPPGRTAVGGGAFAAELHGADVLVELEVDPTEAGPVDIEVRTAFHDGAPLDPEEVTGSLTLPERDLGPLDVHFEPAGETGSYVAPDVEIPFPGEWELEVVVRTSDIDQDRLSTPVTIH